MAYEPDCVTDTRVYVDGTRLPAGEVDLYERKEGPLDLTRYAEVAFASPFAGESYTDLLGASNPDEQTDADTVRIEVKDKATDQYVLAFRGMVTGLGNTVDGPNQMWKLRAQGPGQLLDAIPADIKIGNRQSLEQTLTRIVEQIRPHVPFAVEDPTTDVKPQPNRVIQGPKEALTLLSGYGALVNAIEAYDILTPKSFQPNKHTLADVLDWLTKKLGVHLWFEPTPEGVGFVVLDNPTGRHHRAHQLGGDLLVKQNDALTELRPANTIVVNGKTHYTFSEVNAETAAENIRDLQGPVFGDNSPIRKFVKATIRHEPLYQRAGQRELHVGTNILVDGKSKTEVINEGKKILKERIDGTTSGTMQCLLRAPISPFDTVEAYPVCDSQVNESVTPITYEVSRVHHKVRTGTSEDTSISQTELNLGVHTDPDDDIVVADAYQEEA
jgi:hypothetical protein